MSSFFVEKWSEFHVDDLYHQKYQECLGWIMEATFAISCLLYGITSYIILTQSPKQMGVYKYTVFIQLTSNMLYKVLMFIYNPIFHFPLIALSFNRSYTFSSAAATAFFGSLFFVIIVGAFALMFSVIARLFAAFTIHSTVKSRLRFRYGIAAASGLIAFAWITVFTPMFLMCLKFEDSWKSLEKTVPALLELRRILPNTFVTNPNLVSNFLTPFAAIAAIWVAAYGVVFITLNILFVIQLRKIKKVVSASTYALQKMLHTSLIIQTFNLFIFLIIPVFIILGALVFQLSYGSWITNIQIPISSLHLIIDAPLLIYSVKPYRNFVLKLISKRRHTVLVIELPSFTQIK